jgi:rhodanese-related sulfurtransferase
MKTISFSLLGLVALTWYCFGEDKAQLPSIPNEHIDYQGFLKDASAISQVREQHRITEDQFLRMMDEPGTVVFDARSDDKFRLLHIKGAKHLALTDVTAADLIKVLPDKSARILIYCNNNFDNAPIAFTGKTAKASLNIYTYNTLFSYGYHNVFELGPFIDIRSTKLPFEGTRH